MKKGVDFWEAVLYNNPCVADKVLRKPEIIDAVDLNNPSGCGSAWLERLVWDQEVAGSNPVTPMSCGCSSMVEHQPSKLDTWVRFPSPAFHLQKIWSARFDIHKVQM